MENLLAGHNEDKKKELVKTIFKRLQLSQNYHKEKKDVWEKCYKLYRAKSDEGDDRNEPDIKIAFIFGVVEKIVSKLTAPFAGKLPINIKPKKANHQKQAENYYNMAKDFHNSPRRVIEYANATRERVITGSSWEVEEWNNIYMDGFRWTENVVNEAIDTHLPSMGNMLKPMVGMASKLIRQTPISKYAKIKHKFPVKVGYSLSYPSIFNVFPQPGVLQMEDMKWVIEEQQFVALDDLRAAMYQDDSGELQPVYDISFFDKQKKSDEKKIIVPQTLNDNGEIEDFRQGYSLTGQPNHSETGVDGVYVLIQRSPDEILVTANGEVIQHIKHPYHKPGIKMRIRVYTPDPHSLFGIGGIEPVIPMLEELDDVHNMAMQNWVRIINKMVMYDESAIPYPDDFNPRAGGKIRVKSGTDLNRAFLPVDQADVTATMITTESNLRGLIETILAVTDFSPGTMGTKPYHDTKGGLIEMQQSYAQRFATIIAADQAVTIKQMESMYWFYEQFMFDPVTIEGTYGAVDYTREDIDTDGNGFIMVASSDPSFGDSSVERNQAMVLLSQGIQFEQFRITAGKTHWKELDCSKLMADLITSFKKGDIDEYLINTEETESPENEFKYMIQGIPVQVSPKENLTKHYIEHLKQLKRVQTGLEKYPPEVVNALTLHIEETQDVSAYLLQNPEQFVDEGMRGDIRQGGEMNVTAPNFGQNLPAATGKEGELV